MAGYWPFFFAFFMDREEVEVDKNAKKDEANIQISILNKHCQQRIYHGQNENIFLTGPTRDIPREQEWLGLPVRTQDSLYLARSRIRPYNKIP